MATTKTVESIVSSLVKPEIFVISKFEKNLFSERLIFSDIDKFEAEVQKLHEKGYRMSVDRAFPNKVNANKG